MVDVSCLAEQAKTLITEAKENKSREGIEDRWQRWHTCSLCEQQYHGVVRCALGWACWKTYVGRPETDWARLGAMRQLGNGLAIANHHENALSVKEAELSMLRRLGDSEEHILVTQGNLALTYAALGHLEKALSMERDVYSGFLKLHGEEDERTLQAALNYAGGLASLQRSKAVKALMRIKIPVARRVLGENAETTLRMRNYYAAALCNDDGATLDDLREAVTTLEDTTRIARRVLGSAHPHTTVIEGALQHARAALRARETQPPPRSA